MNVIKEHFVPVTTTLHGRPKDAEGEWWTSVVGQGGWGTGRFHGVTPDGRMICGGDRKGPRPSLGKGCGGGSCDPRKALARWRELPDSERQPDAIRVPDIEKPDPKFPKRPAGSLILKGYNRPLARREDGGFERLKAYWDCQELSVKSMHWKEFKEPEPGRTFIWFTREQLKSLIPSDPRPGMTFPVPNAVADRLIRLPLLNTIF